MIDKSFKWVVLIIAIASVFYLIRTCGRKDGVKQPSSVDKHITKIDSMQLVIENVNTLLRLSRQHLYSLSIQNQILSAQAEKLPKSTTFKKTKIEVDSIGKDSLAKDYEKLYKDDSTKEALLNKSIALNDTSTKAIEKEHEIQDIKDTTCSKQLAEKGVIISEQKEEIAKLTKHNRLNSFLAKALAAVAILAGIFGASQ